MSIEPNSQQQPAERTASKDARLYASSPEGWDAKVKQGWEKEYCYAQNPGEDYFHLILSGEVYVVRGTEKYCLNCALRRGILTTDRIHWQRGPSTAE